MRKLFLVMGWMLLSFGGLRAASYEGWLAYTQGLFSLVVVFMALGTGLLALLFNYKNNYRGDLPFWKYAWNFSLVKLTVFTFALILVSTIAFPRPDMNDPYEKVEFGQYRNLPRLAAEGYKELAHKNPFVMEYHYEYVVASYARDKWGTDNTMVTLDDPEEERPYDFYTRLLMRSNDRKLRDVAILGIAMCNYFESLTSLAEEELHMMEGKWMPFRHFFLGRIAARYGKREEALAHFRQELEYGTSPAYLVPYLAREYKNGDDLEAISALIEDPELEPHLPLYFKRYLYTKQSDLEPYLMAMLTDWLDNVAVIGLLGALGGLLVWFVFLRKVDIFKRTPWAPQAAMVLLGGVSAFSAFPFYDFLEFELNFGPGEGFWSDFFYCIVGIGLIEELVKIIPFLVILRFTNLIRGPLDYIIYASLSGLGFAFVENLLYFDPANISIIHGRVLITTVFHMFATSTVAYGLVLAKYRFRQHPLPWLIGAFVMSALFHGFYDFWLINNQASGFYFLAYVIFIFATFLYASYINNSLNNSAIFRGRTVLDMNHLASYLLVALVIVLLFEYVCLNFVYGVSVGNNSLFRSLGMGSFLMFFVVLNLSYIDVVQGEWFGLRLWNFDSRQNYNKAIGQQLTLKPARKGSVLANFLPVKGEVIARLKLAQDNRYFLFEFDQPLKLGPHELEYVLLRSRDKNAVIEPGYQMEVAVVIFRGREALLKEKKERRDFKHLDYVVVH